MQELKYYIFKVENVKIEHDGTTEDTQRPDDMFEAG